MLFIQLSTSIDYLLLTHAQLDHCGRLPLLVKQGFTGEIITTAASCELARVVLLDSGNLMEDEANYNTEKAPRHGIKPRLNRFIMS